MLQSKKQLVVPIASAGAVACLLTLLYAGLNPSNRLNLVQVESETPEQRISPVNVQKTSTKSGLDSPYRYDCDKVKCTALDEYVWRDNKDFSYEQVAEYGSLIGPRPVKLGFLLND